jgi:hypothetical protein
MKAKYMNNDLKKWDVIAVLWEDAMTQHGPCNAQNYVKEYEPVLRRSVGYLIAKNDRHIHVTATDDRLSEMSDDADEMTTIPMGMVRQVTLLVPAEIPVPGLHSTL